MGKPRKKRGESKEAYIKRASTEMYAEGYHISEIAPKLGTTQFVVYNILMSGSNRITTDDERAVMLELRASGKSYRTIAAMVGRSASCVRARIDRPAKFNNRTGDHYLSDRDINRMKDWYLNGKTITWIANKLHVSRSSVVYRIKNTGIYEPNKSKITPLTMIEKCRITTMKAKNMSDLSIAKEIGRDPNMVTKYIFETSNMDD